LSLKTIRSNPIMLTDVYNLSHQRLKVNTDWEVSHIYNRKEGMILYGFNEMVNEILAIQNTKDMLEQAEAISKKMGVIFPKEIFVRVIEELNGYFPLRIQSLPEGTWCPAGTPFAQVRNTVKGFGEMATWLEGIMLQSSFSCSTATEAFHIRRYLEETKEHYNFDDSFLSRVHSFGFRGYQGGLESAYWGGTAWNMFLFGTDDFHTMIHTPNAKMTSISALAHKVTQQYDVEYDGYIHTIDATADAGEKVVAIVIDTYDADRFIEEYMLPLSLYAKGKGVHLVMRPDSGDIEQQVLAIYKKVKDNSIDNVSVIIGEGISFKNIQRLDFFFKMRQVPLTFVSYGMGGGFYNHITRDTQGLAMKTAYSNGAPRMKFSMEKLKRSIPSTVAIVFNEYGKMMVEREEFAKGNLYETIYFHNDTTSRPIILNSDWNETQELALTYLDLDLQEKIVLSENIESLVLEFEKTYK